MSNLFDDSRMIDQAPTRVVSGDLAQWKKMAEYREYPPAEYSLQYVFRREDSPSDLKVVTGSDETSFYKFVLSSADSAGMRPGVWVWDFQVVRTSDSARLTLAHGNTRIFSNLEEASTDPRIWPRKMLELVEAAIAGRADNKQLDTLAYSIGVETSATRDPKQLREWRTYFQAELNKAIRLQRLRSGKGGGATIEVKL